MLYKTTIEGTCCLSAALAYCKEVTGGIEGITVTKQEDATLTKMESEAWLILRLYDTY